jgi:hypothetical protein
LIWPLLLAGHTPSAIESLLSQKYGAIPSILPFIERLVEEKILSLSEEKTPNSLSLSWPAEFSFPTLERYDEMKNLLMLDPIHEVNEQGWPQRK